MMFEEASVTAANQQRQISNKSATNQATRQRRMFCEVSNLELALSVLVERCHSRGVDMPDKEFIILVRCPHPAWVCEGES